MPITSESQRNRVALLIALNVLIVVGYALFILSSVASPSPLLIAALIAGLGYNLAELWFSTPYQDAPKPAVKPRTVRRTVPRSGVDESPAVIGRSTPSTTALRRQAAGRSPLSERIVALEERKSAEGSDATGRPGAGVVARIEPAVGAPEEIILGAAAAQVVLATAADTLPEAAARDAAPPEGGLSGVELEPSATPAEVDLPPSAIRTVEPATDLADDLPVDPIDLARAYVDAQRAQVQPSPEEEPAHSEHSALTVEIVEAEIETEQPIADVAELENILETVEAGGEAAATMDALAELGTVALAATVVDDSAMPRIPETEPEASLTETETGMDVSVVPAATALEDAIPAERVVLDATPDHAPADPADTQDLPPVAVTVAAASAGEAAGNLSTETEPVVSLASAAMPVVGLGADLLGDEAPVTAAPDVAVAAPETKAPSAEPASGETPPPASVAYLGGRLREPVDIVIANLHSEPERRPAASPRRRAGAGTPSIPVPPRAATGLRASSETLAMLRNQLGVGKERPSEDNAADVALQDAAAQNRTGNDVAGGLAAGGEQIEARPSGGASASVEPPRPPLGAPRRPSPRVADSSRDRVMFVWQGRHFLAPMEGRHPLRVAQSLYDFMIEEEMDRA